MDQGPVLLIKSLEYLKQKNPQLEVFIFIYIFLHIDQNTFPGQSLYQHQQMQNKQTNKQTTTTTKKKKKVNHSNECMNTKEAFDTDQTANIKQVAIIIVIITLINQIY